MCHSISIRDAPITTEVIGIGWVFFQQKLYFERCWTEERTHDWVQFVGNILQCLAIQIWNKICYFLFMVSIKGNWNNEKSVRASQTYEKQNKIAAVKPE